MRHGVYQGASHARSPNLATGSTRSGDEPHPVARSRPAAIPMERPLPSCGVPAHSGRSDASFPDQTRRSDYSPKRSQSASDSPRPLVAQASVGPFGRQMHDGARGASSPRAAASCE